jgi:hypothetical protein
MGLDEEKMVKRSVFGVEKRGFEWGVIFEILGNWGI